MLENVYVWNAFWGNFEALFQQNHWIDSWVVVDFSRCSYFSQRLEIETKLAEKDQLNALFELY